MRVLWVCNIMLPMFAEQLKLEASNKEGWLTGMAEALLAEGEERGITLGIAFPVGANVVFPAANAQNGVRQDVSSDVMRVGQEEALQGFTELDTSTHREDRDAQAQPSIPEAQPGAARGLRKITVLGITGYGFVEDTVHPDRYQPELEGELAAICEDFEPDIVHCFGTEYPHTLALCRAYPHRERILLGLQGILTEYAKVYYADLPEEVLRERNFRDTVKRDTLRMQQEKYERRGVMEREALALADHVTGRTEWDRTCVLGLQPDIHYHAMNESLRSSFYEGQWRPERCEPYSIFVSQGDYPIKGLHYLLKALPAIREKYPQVHVNIAGGDITAYTSLRDKVKLSAYGHYLRNLIHENHLENIVHFCGRLSEAQMKEQYLKSHLFVCCSAIENSPNSIGEAMLLGVPIVTYLVGGIGTIFHSGVDGIGVAVSAQDLDNCNNTCHLNVSSLDFKVKALTDGILKMWDEPDAMMVYSENARNHAKMTHNREANFTRLKEIYANIAERAAEITPQIKGDDETLSDTTCGTKSAELLNDTGNETRCTGTMRDIESDTAPSGTEVK